MKKILFIFGTRPEAIKMAPIIKEGYQFSEQLNIKIAVTGQHKEMLFQVMDFFELKADYDLALMKPNQSLFSITADALVGLETILSDFIPDWVIVQGDTTTAFAGALAAFYKKIKVAHVEAGLRSFDKYAPFPEEINRKMVGSLADLHFAPTTKAVDSLQQENINQAVYLTGNTVIDALLWAVDKTKHDDNIKSYFQFLDLSKKIILVTGHRRENFGKPFEDICDAILHVAQQHSNVQIVYPVHLNPNVQQIVHQKLGNQANIFLIQPLDYPYLVWLMNTCYIVLTDSGGIQEEAPALGKPVLVMREVTERMEGVEAGTAKLVGTNKDLIISELNHLLTIPDYYNQMSKAVNPYGKGDSAKKIIRLLIEA